MRKVGDVRGLSPEWDITLLPLRLQGSIQKTEQKDPKGQR